MILFVHNLEDHDAFETDLDFEDIDHLNGISDSESLTKSVESKRKLKDFLVYLIMVCFDIVFHFKCLIKRTK